eukprot:CAMPEP_0184501518 /NCGR_PEP_ID=MMETSP0113_2-20130426/47928_1 /TAXON_ID=91329 /ORGANISM="Norrisiella sphaerica, Strain BC52" /LENGTH=46 /DNA_ID= /DNA_START= /DNA_END= /DNA_ORIENTATION=
MKVDGTHQRTIATVSKLCDDEATGIAKVFVAVVECGVDHANFHHAL